MRKRESWMKKGIIVLALGKPGTITKMETNTIDGVDYVYRFYVRLSGHTYSGVYHHADVQELITEEVAS